MGLPVTNEYLSKALLDGARAGIATLSHRQVGDIVLPSGKLVACDPFVFSGAEPFEVLLPKGVFPVTLSVAKFDNNDQRVAFAAIHFRKTSPAAWDMLTVEGQDCSQLKPDEIIGYPVDAGTGSFMDVKGADALESLMEANPDFYEVISTELEKTYTHTWSWTNYKFNNGETNMVAFSSGFGDGVYATYAGFDADGEISVVMTDFGVVPTN